MREPRLRVGELCAGYGGLGLAVEWVMGAETAWLAEIERNPPPRRCLRTRSLAGQPDGRSRLGQIRGCDPLPPAASRPYRTTCYGARAEARHTVALRPLRGVDDGLV